MRLKTAVRIFPRLWGENGYLRSAGYVFLVGHMRSYSSLLGHILGSHPRIAGYAEMHQKYRNALDLLELSDKVGRTCDKPSAGRYVFDKILHPQDLHSRVLRRDDVKVILMARAPQPTLASILGIRAGGIGSIAEAIDYYLGRLLTLIRVCQVRDGDVFYLDSESILQDTERTLGRLSSYLGIAPRLRSEYSIFRFTGVSKYGDPSEVIKSGRVLGTQPARPQLPLDASQVRRVTNAHESLRLYMQQCARASLARDAPQDLSPTLAQPAIQPAR